jgi:hypothetical protein
MTTFNNKSIVVFDNIGANFITNNNDFTILGSIEGYQTLGDNHLGYYIPYLAKCTSPGKSAWEIGIGYVEKLNSQIVVKRLEITDSSNGSNAVDFSILDGNKHFYIFVNANKFNTGLNNVLLRSSDFEVEASNALYIVDTSSGLVHASLPEASKNPNLEVRFRVVSNDGRLAILYQNNILSMLSAPSVYTSLISDGNTWIELNPSSKLKDFDVQSQSTPTFSAQSQVNGALPYNNNGSDSSTNLFWGNNSKLLFGNTQESLASHIIPTTGDYSTIINNSNNNSNFIVYGSGETSNLYFSKDGRLGLNMPTGLDGNNLQPITLLHLVNTFCRDAIRVDNRSDCYPASVNLYHRPVTESNIQADREIAKFTMSSVTTDKVYTTFANIVAKSKSVTPGSSKGQLEINVNNGSPLGTVTTISTSSDETKLGYPSSNVNISGSSISINSSSVALNGNVSMSGGISVTSLATPINMNGVSIGSGNEGRVTLGSLYINDSTIPANKLLAVGTDKKLYAATGLNLGLSPNKIVTTDASGTLVGVLNSSSYLATGPDMTWNKYSPKVANICLKQLTFVEAPSIEEFSVGDQIAMIDSSGNYLYRYISQLTANGNSVSSLILDQDVGITASTSVSVFSVSKGGYLLNQVASVNGPPSDATYIKLSTRPGVDTIFNGNRKNINFSVYSTEDSPTFKVLSNASTVPLLRGQYFKYATQVKLEDGFQSSPVSTIVAADLSLPSNTNEQNSVNYNASSVSKQSTGKSSFYGTFDQNGNAFEWVENTNALQNDRINSWRVGTQYVCGGSWKTNSSDKLRSIVAESYTSKKPDIGFRICKRSGYAANGILFSSIANIDNPPDSTPLYKEAAGDRYSSSPPDIDEQSFVSIPNLGRVNHLYDISSYEITNSQYLNFLQNIDPSAENASEYYVTTNEYNDNSKGITVQNNTYVLVNSNYANAPVVYVSYLNAIRYINWLHNGALSYSQMEAIAIADSETINNVISRNIGDGAYSIGGSTGSIDITKNRDQKYWLPSLNEWHKAAYYKAGVIVEQGGTSAITIKTDVPKEISAGKLASVTVGGPLYTDSLVVGTYDDVNNILRTNIDATNNYNVSIGTKDLLTVPPTQAGAGTYGTFISNTGIVLAANGTIKIVCANSNNSNIFELSPTGVFVPKLTIGNGDTKTVIDGGTITKVETTTGGTGGSTTNTIEQYEGPISGVIYKFSKINDDQTVTIDAKSSDAIIVSPENSSVTLKKSAPGSLIYANENSGYMEGHANITYQPTVEGIGSKASGVLVFGSGQAIDVPLIRIGPTLDSYAGRILVHKGTDVAEWGPSDFLRADGVTYNRFTKRAVTFATTSSNLIKNQFSFTDLGTDKGGTGPISVKVMINGQEQTLTGIDAIRHEFNSADTIAIYSPTNKVHYAKIRTTIFQGGDILDTAADVSNASFFQDEATLTVLFGPPVPWGIEDVTVKSSDGETKLLAYAFSIQKGSYLDMDIEKDANYRFDNDGRNDASYRGFKPSTANTLSIRPTVHTAFNKVAEDIDFAIYGHRNTLYRRYEDWFNRDDSGLPTGITPAFYVNAKLENSFEGSIVSGVFKSSLKVPRAEDNTLLPDQIFAQNVFPDLSPKVCINTKNSYPVTILSGVYRGKIFGKPGQIPQDEITYGLQLLPSGYLASGTSPLTKYADLTVSGYLYSNNVITDDIYFNYDKKATRPKYITNAPLTVNQFGQVVSIVPPAPPTPPGPPSGIVVDRGYDGVTLYWKAASDNRSTIYGYDVQYSSDNINWTLFKKSETDVTSSSGLFVFIPKLSDNAQIIDGRGIGEGSYWFRNQAINYEGSGTYSNIVGPYTVDTNVSSITQNLILDRKLDRNDDGTYKYITENVMEDGFTIERSTNPSISWGVPANNGAASITKYTVDYAPAYDFDPITEVLTPVKQLVWTSATLSSGSITYTGDIPANTNGTPPNDLILQNILSDFTYYFRVRAFTLGKGYGTPSIIKSPGTLTEPVISAPVTEEEDWDFGVITFNGGCS